MKRKRKRKHLETTRAPKAARTSGEFENSQEDSPEPEARVVVPDHSLTPGEEPSISEYFSCVSRPGQLPATAEDGGGGGGIPLLHQDILRTGPLEMTQPQVLEEREAPSLSTEDSFPLYLGRAHIKKIYYRRVQMKRGVAVSWDEVEVYEPASKKTKREFAFFEEAEKKGEETSDIWSRLSTRQLIDVSDYSEAPEEREQAGSAGEPPAQEESPRAKTPEWLVALDSGFRCLGCCRVFPSLEVLQDHVANAILESNVSKLFGHKVVRYEGRQRTVTDR
ncbi:protein FAM170A-like [Manis pentadactyla]|uniref:protein FAM170A-like n=1 Tax=Manis pentadactyla TaxID=143292 RepID=UPI00255CF5EB|nr:protein FAM170A-like [Manis pentadactyla]